MTAGASKVRCLHGARRGSGAAPRYCRASGIGTGTGRCSCPTGRAEQEGGGGRQPGRGTAGGVCWHGPAPRGHPRAPGAGVGDTGCFACLSSSIETLPVLGRPVASPGNVVCVHSECMGTTRAAHHGGSRAVGLWVLLGFGGFESSWFVPILCWEGGWKWGAQTLPQSWEWQWMGRNGRTMVAVSPWCRHPRGW